MGDVREATLTLRIDSEQAKQALLDFVKVTDGVGIATNKTGLSFDLLIKKLAAIGIAYKLYHFGKDTLDAADQADRAARMFNTAFGDMADSARAWAGSVAQSMKVGESDVERASARFKFLFDNMGASAQTSTQMSEDVTELALRLSVLNRIPVDEVFSKLQSGMMGNTRGLRELGVAINETTLEEYALQKGWMTSGQKLSELGRAYVTYRMVMEQTARSTKSLAEANMTYGEQTRQLGTNLKEIEEAIGEGLAPVVTKSLSAINEALEASLPHIRRWAKDFSEGFTAVKEGAQWLANQFKSKEFMPESYRQKAIEDYRQRTGDTQAFTSTTNTLGTWYESPQDEETWQRVYHHWDFQWQMDKDRELRLQKEKERAEAQAAGQTSPATEAATAAPSAAAKAAETQDKLPEGGLDTRKAQEYLQQLKRGHEVLTLTNEERAKRIALNEAGVTSEQAIGRQIEKEVAALEKARRLVEMAHDIGNAFGQTFEDVVLGAKKAGEAVNALLMDIARAIIRKQITEPLADAIGAGLGSIFTGAAGVNYSGAGTGATVAHGGWRAGMPGASMRALSPWLFATAPRLHSGLASDEYPAILQRGETVLTGPQMSALSAKPNVTVNISNNSSAPVNANVSDLKLDLRRMVVGIVLEDQQTNEPISRGYRR